MAPKRHASCVANFFRQLRIGWSGIFESEMKELNIPYESLFMYFDENKWKK